MVHYSLVPENPTKSCKSRGSNLFFHFKNTHENCSSPHGYACPHSQQVPEGCHFIEAMCAILSLQWWSWYMCPVQQWGQIQGQLPKKTAEVLLHMLKNAEWPWLDGTIGWSILPYTKSLLVQFPVRAHAWAVGLVPGWE